MCYIYLSYTYNYDSNIFLVTFFDAIKKKDGYVYYWFLYDYEKKRENGNMSHKNYYQIDCKTLNYKFLIQSSHKEPMSRGTGKIEELSNEWFETPSWWEKLLLIKRDSDRNIREKVCEHANLHEKN